MNKFVVGDRVQTIFQAGVPTDDAVVTTLPSDIDGIDLVVKSPGGYYALRSSRNVELVKLGWVYGETYVSGTGSQTKYEVTKVLSDGTAIVYYSYEGRAYTSVFSKAAREHYRKA